MDTSSPSAESSADRCRRLRRQRGWSQRALANWLGVGASTVGGYETGLPVPGPVCRLLDLLERDLYPPVAPAATGEHGSASPLGVAGACAGPPPVSCSNEPAGGGS